MSGADDGTEFKIVATVTDGDTAIADLPEQPEQTSGVTVTDNGDGTLTIKLNGGESATLALPKGAKLVVVETTTAASATTGKTVGDLYTVSYKVGESETGTIEAVNGGEAVEVINTRDSIAVKVTKTVSGADNGDKFEMTVKVYDGNTQITSLPQQTDTKITKNENGTLTIELLNGETANILVPKGSKVEVVEKTNPLYNVSYSPANSGNTAGVITEAAAGDKITVTNTRKTADITVKKLVEGNMGDLTAPFGFTVTVKETNGTEIALAAADVEFSLKHNETHLIEDLPVGATVTVIESENDYNTSTSNVNIADGEFDKPSRTYVFTVPAQNATAIFTNELTIKIDTGIDMDAVPYMVLLGVGLSGLAVLAVTRRKRRKDETA